MVIECISMDTKKSLNDLVDRIKGQEILNEKVEIIENILRKYIYTSLSGTLIRVESREALIGTWGTILSKKPIREQKESLNHLIVELLKDIRFIDDNKNYGLKEAYRLQRERDDLEYRKKNKSEGY